mgnify:FL=1
MFMRDELWQIEKNEQIAKDIYEMRLTGKTQEIKRPGQFINILIEQKFLRRPLSIASWDKDGLTVVYKVVGEGTEILRGMKEGQSLRAMCPLGNGYDTEDIPKASVLAGGGMGAAPIYSLAESLVRAGKEPKIVLGFKNEEEIFFRERFEKLGADLQIKVGGVITELIKEGSYVCACGPLPMFEAVCGRAADGQFSFEERMGCGFGSCMGCVCKKRLGEKRICKDGPVFRKEEILWQTQE